jgi:hypothetical protein
MARLPFRFEARSSPRKDECTEEGERISSSMSLSPPIETPGSDTEHDGSGDDDHARTSNVVPIAGCGAALYAFHMSSITCERVTPSRVASMEISEYLGHFSVMD